MLDFVDEALDEMTFLVDVLVVGDRLGSRDHGWNHGGDRTIGQVRPELVGVKGFVADHLVGGDQVDQGFGLRALVDLPGREKKPERIAKGVDGDMDLRAQATARATDRLILKPPFAPAEC
jgi:hypothetical protein